MNLSISPRETFTRVLRLPNHADSFPHPLPFRKQFISMKTRSVILLTAAAVAATQLNSFAGDITGVVTLKGTPPAETPLPAALQQDATCGKAYPTLPTTHHFVVGKEGELANVVVMLKGISGKSTGASA